MSTPVLPAGRWNDLLDASDDRRGERRVAVAGRLTWRGSDNDVTATGWLSDESDRSLSFITTADRTPMPGDQILLRLPGFIRRRCRVTRVAPYGEGSWLIAGRRVNSDEVTRPTQLT